MFISVFKNCHVCKGNKVQKFQYVETNIFLFFSVTQWSPVDGESHEDNDGEEGTNEDLYDPETATRFEELLNKIDEHENDEGAGDHEDEKPPGEETQAEFEVTAFTPDEKPAEAIETTVKNIDKPKSNVENTLTEKSEAMQQDATTVTVNNTSSTEVATAPETAKVSEPASTPENNTQGNDTQASVTSGVESGGLEASPMPRTKAARGRKRQAAGGRKKTARNTKTKKAVEDIAGPEEGLGNNNDTDGLTGTEDDVKKAKVDGELSQESTDADESMEGEAPEDTKPKRVTRARSQRRKK